MIRIVHVSDLHLAKPGASVLPDADTKELLQSVTSHLLQEAGVTLNVKVHDAKRLDALNIVLDELRPDVLAVTGDLTTYGDRESMRWGAEILEAWRQKYGKGEQDQARCVLCIPGNHDALQERLAELKRQGGAKGDLAAGLGKFVKSFENLLQGTEMPPTSIKPSPFLDAYAEEVEKRFGAADPADPVWIETAWGWLCLFLFNSVNDPGWMANEGRIGAAQFNRLNSALGSTEFNERKGQALRFALLHHHPLPIPHVPDTPAERFYDDMQDGSTLCHYLNTQDFHFVLHGHKHQPYMCRVQYDGSGDLYVLAAGSATQSGEDQARASFNVIDLLSPFQGVVRRYEYLTTGFHENVGLRRTIEPKPVSSFRYTESPIEQIADQDLRNVLTINPEGFENNHSLSVISWEVSVENDVYRGRYRLEGACTKDGVEGIRQVLTGSPDRSWEELSVRAWREQDKRKTVARNVIESHPRQKCFELRHGTIGRAGQGFDYTYEFQWQNDPADDTYFDAFNLFYYGQPIGEFSYSITLPWQPAGARVAEYGLASKTVLPLDEKLDDLLDGRFRYSFRLEKPKLLLYLVRLPKLGEQG